MSLESEGIGQKLSPRDHQPSEAHIEKLVNHYFADKFKERLLLALKFISIPLEFQIQSLQQNSTYYHRFICEFIKILNESYEQQVNNKYDKISYEQQEKLSALIKSYEQKVQSQIVSFMRKNSLLKSIKNSKLQQIARSYQISILPKNECLQFRAYDTQRINLYYLLNGDVQKIRYYTFCDKKDTKKKAQSFSISNAQSPSLRINNQSSFSLKKKIDQLHQRSLSNKKERSKKRNQEENSKLKNLSVSLKIPPISNRSFLHKRKTMSRNTLRTLIQTGQFIGDQFFSTKDPDHNFPLMTKFIVTSQKAVLIHFPGQLIKKILEYNNYLEDSKPFYNERSSIQLKEIHSMRLFDKKYKKQCKKNEQNRLKSNCSPQMEDMKKRVLKRYVTSNSNSQVDTNSPKQLSKILNTRRKKMNINRKNNFQLPMVEVFATHSQKKRSHENVALAPMAIVKTTKNSELLNKPDSVISKGQKSEIYQIRSWQSSTDLTVQDKLPPALKKLHEVVKQKKRTNCGFQLMQLDRVLQKIKLNLKKK